MTVQTIPSIQQMTPNQRIELWVELWKALALDVDDGGVQERHRRIFEERSLALANGETHFIPWDEARARLMKLVVDRG